jgi:hypothetical protein
MRDSIMVAVLWSPRVFKSERESGRGEDSARKCSTPKAHNLMAPHTAWKGTTHAFIPRSPQFAPPTVCAGLGQAHSTSAQLTSLQSVPLCTLEHGAHESCHPQRRFMLALLAELYLK